MLSEPGKAQNVNHEPDYGVIACLKERDRPKHSMAPITKGRWILTPVCGCARQSRPYWEIRDRLICAIFRFEHHHYQYSTTVLNCPSSSAVTLRQVREVPPSNGEIREPAPQSRAPPHGWKVLEFGSSCFLLLQPR